MTPLVIQHVKTVWTKTSRGGHAARRRNSTPESVLLPSEFASAASRFRMHRVLFDESAGFQAAHSTALGNAIESVCPRVVMLQLDRDHVDVGLIRDPFNAATAGRWPRDGSDNDISARRGFRIDIGNWGQIIQNGRYVDADTGEWSYEKSVYNIAFVSEVTREVFVSSDPDHRHVELARLL